MRSRGGRAVRPRVASSSAPAAARAGPPSAAADHAAVGHESRRAGARLCPCAAASMSSAASEAFSPAGAGHQLGAGSLRLRLRRARQQARLIPGRDRGQGQHSAASSSLHLAHQLDVVDVLAVISATGISRMSRFWRWIGYSSRSMGPRTPRSSKGRPLAGCTGPCGICRKGWPPRWPAAFLLLRYVLEDALPSLAAPGSAGSLLMEKRRFSSGVASPRRFGAGPRRQGCIGSGRALRPVPPHQYRRVVREVDHRGRRVALSGRLSRNRSTSRTTRWYRSSTSSPPCPRREESGWAGQRLAQFLDQRQCHAMVRNAYAHGTLLGLPRCRGRCARRPAGGRCRAGSGGSDQPDAASCMRA